MPRPLTGEASGGPSTVRPNILVVMTDDQRRDAMGAYGNAVLRTPNMDRLAEAGVRFEHAFVTNSLCAPSRASFLTGLYSHAHGQLGNPWLPHFQAQEALAGRVPTYVDHLRQAGWHTGLIGKWHMRSPPTGFDHWAIFAGGGYLDPELSAVGVRVPTRGHSDDVAGDQALAFLQSRPPDRPFCLLVNFKSPHRNWIPAARHESAFADVVVPVPRTFEDRLEGRPQALHLARMAVADMPDFRDRGVPASLPEEERKRRNLEELVKNYYRTLLGVDDNLGRILEALDQAGQAGRTVVVFTSDNGFFLGEHGLFDKRLMYEPSIRVPLLVRYPPRARPGLVDGRHMVLNVDLAPTLLELAGLPVPEGLHGRSLVPLLEGQDPPWRDAFLYEYYEHPGDHCVRKNRGLRTARFKLIHFWEQPEEWELYDLLADPDETVNLAGQAGQAARLEALRRRLEELRRAVGDADLPGPAPVAAPCQATT